MDFLEGVADIPSSPMTDRVNHPTPALGSPDCCCNGEPFPCQIISVACEQDPQAQEANLDKVVVCMLVRSGHGGIS